MPVPLWAWIGGAPPVVVALHLTVFVLLIAGLGRVLCRRPAPVDQSPQLDRTALRGLRTWSRLRVPWEIILAALLGTVVLSPLLMIGHDLVLDARPSRYEITQQLDKALRELDEAVGVFKDQTGCYPEHLLDLVNTQPTYGLDSSGNRVPIASPLRAVVLQELPTDPLTGRSDTWVYDVLAPQVVDSGAYEITVERSSP